MQTRTDGFFRPRFFFHRARAFQTHHARTPRDFWRCGLGFARRPPADAKGLAGQNRRVFAAHACATCAAAQAGDASLLQPPYTRAHARAHGVGVELGCRRGVHVKRVSRSAGAKVASTRTGPGPEPRRPGPGPEQAARRQTRQSRSPLPPCPCPGHRQRCPSPPPRPLPAHRHCSHQSRRSCRLRRKQSWRSIPPRRRGVLRTCAHGHVGAGNAAGQSRGSEHSAPRPRTLPWPPPLHCFSLAASGVQLQGRAPPPAPPPPAAATVPLPPNAGQSTGGLPALLVRAAHPGPFRMSRPNYSRRRMIWAGA